MRRWLALAAASLVLAAGASAQNASPQVRRRRRGDIQNPGAAPTAAQIAGGGLAGQAPQTNAPQAVTGASGPDALPPEAEDVLPPDEADEPFPEEPDLDDEGSPGDPQDAPGEAGEADEAEAPAGEDSGAVDACAVDLDRLCPDASGPAAEKACLKKNSAALSPACRAKTEAPSIRALADACRNEINLLCGDAAPKSGKLQRCLAAHRADATPDCRRALPRASAD